MENEKRLIDANSLKNQFLFLRKMWSGTEISSVVDKEPTVDAVEVVHNKLFNLPYVSDVDYQNFVDGLADYFKEAAFEDKSVGIFGMTDGEIILANALMDFLTEKGRRLPMCIEHRGYFIQQSTYNNHIMIVKDDRMVLHSACTEKKTEQQLRRIVDGYIKYTESNNVADIYKDAEG